MNLSDLTRLQRHWSALMTNTAPQDDHLTETAEFGSDPGALRMLSAIPAGLAAGAPLVVALHGCGQNAAEYDTGTGWSQLAERHGFAVLLPEQRRANNGHTCFNWFQPDDTARGEGETASIRQMIARCVADHRLDPARIFVTGLSAGGAMTAVMLATYPEVFAGGAIIAGLPYGAASSMQDAFTAMQNCPARPAAFWGDLVRAASPVRGPHRPAVSIWHGDSDQTVTQAAAQETLKQWLDVHGLALDDAVEDRVDGVRHRVWRGAGGTVPVESYAVPGLGHGIPITPHAEGDRGVGQAMPFILDSMIPSTWHIARSWGLLAG